MAIMKAKIFNGLLAVMMVAGFLSCSDESNEIGKVPSAKPGVYSMDITVSAANGDGSDANISSTRGLDHDGGVFTEDYPYDYIYVHSDDNYEDDRHQVLKVPLKEVEFCGDCRGIHLECEVMDDGNGYTISNEAGESIHLNDDQSVYFSTIPTPFWEATVATTPTPVSLSDVFVDDPDVNLELLRSKEDYSKDELVALLQEMAPVITLTRHCTGFRVYFMFTNVRSEGSTSNMIDEYEWADNMNGYSPYNFYIKLYFGPNFAHKYDMLNNSVVTNDVEGGYYATNNQTYQPFEYMEYDFTGGSSSSKGHYWGYGYLTDDNKYLLSPLNSNIPAEEFSLYAFVKFSTVANNTDAEFLSSDAGSKYFQATIPGMTLELNRVHFIILAFHYEDLKAFLPGEDASGVSTRAAGAWDAPQKIDIKPYKVIVK